MPHRRGPHRARPRAPLREPRARSWRTRWPSCATSRPGRLASAPTSRRPSTCCRTSSATGACTRRSRCRSGAASRARSPPSSLDGDLELGVASYDPGDDQLVAKVIYTDALAFVVSPKHRLARRRSVSIAELGMETFIAHNVVSPYREVVLREFRATRCRSTWTSRCRRSRRSAAWCRATRASPSCRACACARTSRAARCAR